MLGKRKEGAWFQYAVGFRKECRAIGYLHGDVLCDGAIEGGVRVREVLTVAVLNIPLPLHAEQRREFVGRLDEWLSDVDATHIALKPLCQVACSAAQAAPDIDDMLAGL